jgi:hypothetical protein
VCVCVYGQLGQVFTLANGYPHNTDTFTFRRKTFCQEIDDKISQ